MITTPMAWRTRRSRCLHLSSINTDCVNPIFNITTLTELCPHCLKHPFACSGVGRGQKTRVHQLGHWASYWGGQTYVESVITISRMGQKFCEVVKIFGSKGGRQKLLSGFFPLRGGDTPPFR